MNELINLNPPLMPCLPASLASLIKTSYRNFENCLGFWEMPKAITATQRREIVSYLQVMRQTCPAPSPEALKGRIGTLLAHYFLASTNESINSMVASDWINALEIFPKASIDQACAWWRDNETRKPKPADIRKLAIMFFGEVEWEKIMRLKTMADLPIEDQNTIENEKKEEWVKPTAEMKARVAELVRGMSSK